VLLYNTSLSVLNVGFDMVEDSSLPPSREYCIRLQMNPAETITTELVIPKVGILATVFVPATSVWAPVLSTTNP